MMYLLGELKEELPLSLPKEILKENTIMTKIDPKSKALEKPVIEQPKFKMVKITTLTRAQQQDICFGEVKLLGRH